MPPSIFISAGEASGEHYGALLVTALKRQLAAALARDADFYRLPAYAGGEAVLQAISQAS